jgi:pimeloyl-ACP methyl ester carboxylesterase
MFLPGLVLAAPLDPAQIHYREFGNPAAEPLILIHGLDSSSQTFGAAIGPLSQQYRVVVYDQRGHGQTAAVGDDYSTAVMAGDLEVLLDHLGIQQAHLLGHSMGGRTAARFAQLHPERVKSLIIEDMELIQRNSLGPNKIAKRIEVANALRVDFAQKTFPSMDVLLATFQKHFRNRWDSEVRRRSIVHPDGTVTLLFNPDVSVLYGSQANYEDLSHILDGLNKPILFIRADPQLGSAMSDVGAWQVQSVPGAFFVQVPGADHSVHKSQTEAFLRVVTQFLNPKTRKNLANQGSKTRESLFCRWILRRWPYRR